MSPYVDTLPLGICLHSLYTFFWKSEEETADAAERASVLITSGPAAIIEISYDASLMESSCR
jgi:hypothetical protein